MSTRVYNILNLGAGVQSTMVAMLPKHLPDKVPVFDCAIFADTGEEPKQVYSHLEWLISQVDYPVYVRSAGTRLGDDLLNGGVNGREDGFFQIPTYLAEKEGEKTGIARRQCTLGYKIRVIENTIKREVLGMKKGQHMAKDVQIVQWTGLSWDEPLRVNKLMAHAKGQWTYKSPLFDMQITRTMAAVWLKDKVPHVVPRSACTFCPYHNNKEWRWVKENDPEGWARSVMLDKALRDGAKCGEGLNHKQYLHESCVPLDQADLKEEDPRQDHLFSAECMGMCGV